MLEYLVMQFFFVKDFRSKYRFFSSAPIHQIKVEFSRLTKILNIAKEKLLLLPPRILRQEQAFAEILKLKEEEIQIFIPEYQSEKKLKVRFFFYLQKQKTKHILILVAEAIMMPISGLMALLPGPNVFFGVLALLMITHWRALRGINQLGKKKSTFTSSPLLTEWKHALEIKNEREYNQILEKIEKQHELHNIRKILYK